MVISSKDLCSFTYVNKADLKVNMAFSTKSRRGSSVVQQKTLSALGRGTRAMRWAGLQPRNRLINDQSTALGG